LLRGVLTEPQEAVPGAVIMVAGFERAASTEKKFKHLADSLGEMGVASLRLDVAGIGLSDGDYGKLTVDTMASGLSGAAAWLRERGYPTVNAVGHSLGACALVAAWSEAAWNRVAFLAPALDQASLLRYYYIKRERPDMDVTWDNFRDMIDEDRFRLVLSQGLVTKHYRIAPSYFEENMGRNYAGGLVAYRGSIMHVHGELDDKVPVESVGLPAVEMITVTGGDHDLERPGQMEQWLVPTARWLMI